MNWTDLGLTEDQASNFQIDLWETMNCKRNPETKKYYYFDFISGESVETDEPPPPVTITITNYVD